MLTRKQHELLLFINERLSRDGVSPSFDEMKEALGLKSKSGIHRLITGLEERGFIRRLAHHARAIEVIRGDSATEDRAMLLRRLADAENLLQAVARISPAIVAMARGEVSSGGER